MNRLFASLTVLTVLVPSVTHAADAYDRLRQHLSTYDPLLQQFQSDQELEAMEMRLDAGSDFFPETPEEATLTRRTATENTTHVTFRIAGVPYALTDVPLSMWFSPYVRDMAERGIVSGYRDSNGVPTGIFGPERNVSIEELAKMAIEAARLPRSGCATAKNAAALTSWSADYIACAEQVGLAVYADGTVDMKRRATRAEVVMTILQAFGTQLQDVPAEGSAFKDVNASTLFAPAIYTASKAGIIAGYTDANGNSTGEFGPDKPVNRAEVAKILSLGIQVYGR